MAVDLTPEQVAEELGLHRESVYRLLRAGVIPGYKAGLRQWRTPRLELDAYKQSGRVQGVGRPCERMRVRDGESEE